MKKIIDFDEVSAKEYDLWYQTEKGKYISSLENKLMVDLLKPQTGQKLLDIGCGTGNHLLYFLEKNLFIYGIDSSYSMLKEAEKKTSGKKVVINAGAQSLPFLDKSFDISIIFTTLEFCDDPVSVLKEAERVTREKIYLGVLNSFSFTSALRRIKGWFKFSIYNRARFYSIWKLKRMFSYSFNFSSIQWGGVGFFPWVHFSFFRWIDKKTSFKRNPFSTFLGILIKL